MSKFYSPLRYPGGKNKLAKFVAQVCEKNNINGHYVEPYAGGASVALYLLINGFVNRITINDIDRPIYAFWYSVLYKTNQLIRLIEKKPVNTKTWRECKKIHKNGKQTSLIKLGFSTFFLNRTNRSGILNAGPIGGQKQRGKYKIFCRYDKKELIARIKLIASYKKHINLKNFDALKLVKEIKRQTRSKNTILYFDPPYYLRGQSLYFNHYKHKNHKEVSKEITKIKNFKWIVTYDNTRRINKMYSKFRNKKYTLPHSAFKSRVGKEIIFFSKNLIIPRIANPVLVS